LSLFSVQINNALTFFFYHISGFCFCLQQKLGYPYTPYFCLFSWN